MAMTRPLPLCDATRLIMACCTVDSLMVRPGDSTLVLSLMNSVTPSRPAANKASNS